MDPLLLPRRRRPETEPVKTIQSDQEDDYAAEEDLLLEQTTESLKDGDASSAATTNSLHNTWTLRIKSLRDVVIHVQPRDSIAVVKQAVRLALAATDVAPELQARPYLRLVCKGRLLAPDGAILQELHGGLVQTNDVVHAVLATQAPREGPQAALQRGGSTTTARPGGTTTAGPSRRAWRGAGINANGIAVRQTSPNSDDEEEEEDEDIENNGTLLGLDRLRHAGLRRSDISVLRTYFGRPMDRFIRQNPVATAFAHESDPRRRRLLQEDAWMAAQGPLSEFRININGTAAGNAAVTATGPAAWNTATAANRANLSPSEALWRSGGLSAHVGTDKDFVWGFLLGFLVGLLMLVWVWMPSVPHKQKLGILTGICLQLALTMLQTSTDLGEQGGMTGDFNQAALEGGDDYLWFSE
jgi:hypothetical protein